MLQKDFKTEKNPKHFLLILKRHISILEQIHLHFKSKIMVNGEAQLQTLVIGILQQI
jgi:hypothetical protein